MIVKTPKLVELCKLARKKNPLKIVVAIDEGSGCPLAIRSIIHNQADAATVVARALGTEHVEIMFSVAGTGALSGAIGSNTDNFEIESPSARSMTKELCNHFLGSGLSLKLPGDQEVQQVTYERIRETLPAVATLMENGRMASITATRLRNLAASSKSTAVVVEADIVSSTVDSFMKSNGMQILTREGNEKLKRTVAACAFAVHLFQWGNGTDGIPTPYDSLEFQKFMNSMRCGVEFSEHVEKTVGVPGAKLNTMQRIVRNFGLLEPSVHAGAMQPGFEAKNLFVMTSAQQLVALTLLGMTASSFLEASPFGFEILSTHVAKCAIAASSVIKEPERPNLQTTLSKIGFRLDPHDNTDSSVKGEWENLESYKVANHTFNEEEDAEAFETRQMNVGLELFADEDGIDLLQIAKDAFRTLLGMGVSADDEFEGALPSTWINYGASLLADGFVTFFCKKTDERGAFRFTLMIQAKDYHNKSKLNIKKLKGHADRCKDVSLDGVFGECRLLCVAGSKDIVEAKQKCTQKRHFVPYASDKGEILKALLAVLESQRNANTRAKRFGTLCNARMEEYLI